MGLGGASVSYQSIRVCDLCQKDDRTVSVSRFGAYLDESQTSFAEIDLCKGCSKGVQLDKLKDLVRDTKAKIDAKGRRR